MRVPHDHPSVDTIDGEVRSDRLDRLRVYVPAALPVDRVLRVVLEGTERYGQCSADGEGVLLRDVHATPEGARGDERPGRLGDWLRSAGLGAGRTVRLDVVEAGYKYGLRAPGERAVYRAGRPPSDLADIARDLDT